MKNNLTLQRFFQSVFALSLFLSTTTLGIPFDNPFGTAQPTNFIYVSPSGLNANDGTINSPKQTIQAALNSCIPGTAIMAKTGIYNENISISKSGTASAPIWILSTDGIGSASIVPLTSQSTIQGYGINYMIIQGFAITAPHAAGGDNDGIKMAQVTDDYSKPNSHIAILDNIIRSPTDGFCTIKISQIDNLYILRNQLFDSEVDIDLVACQKSEIAYNFCSHSGINNSYGIYEKGGSYDITVHHNYVNGSKFGIFFGQSSASYTCWSACMGS